MAAHQLAPEGPILASFWHRESDAPIRRNTARQHLLRWGHRLASWRGIEPNPETQFSFSPGYGFGVYLTMEEMKALAVSLRRPVSFQGQPYAHLTLAPPRNERLK